MIVQVIGNRYVNTVTASGSADDMASLATLLEGELTTFELKFEGGTVAPAPASLNAKKFSVGKKYLSGQYKSCSVRIPHVKPTKMFGEISLAVIGQFDESFDSAVKCNYASLYFDKKEVA